VSYRLLLCSLAACAPQGTELVFTYMDQRVFVSKSESFLAFKDRVAAMGEPFLSGFDPGTRGGPLPRFPPRGGGPSNTLTCMEVLAAGLPCRLHPGIKRGSPNRSNFKGLRHVASLPSHG
jgi:hypothetical protein